MKKIIVLFLTILFMFKGCGTFSEEKGLENFDVGDSSLSLCQHLIPDGFIELFEYEEGDYYYLLDEKAPFYHSYEKILLYLKYDEKTYFEAKQYSIDELELSEDVKDVYNNYFFYDNQTAGNKDYLNDYPYIFVRFAYNDDKQTLVFMAFAVSDDLFSEVDEISGDWGALLEKYFGEIYSFS